MAALTIHKAISIAASPESIFDALTNSDMIVKYYPLDSVISDWVVGGKVHYKGKANGTPFTDFGIIEILDRPSQYKYSYWSDNHGTTRTPENFSSICYQIEVHENYCTLNLIQEKIPSAELFEIMNSSVWDFLLKNFKDYMETQAVGFSLSK